MHSTYMYALRISFHSDCVYTKALLSESVTVPAGLSQLSCLHCQWMIDYLHTRMGKENEEERDKDTRCPTLPLTHSIPLFCVVLCVLAVLEWESTTYAKDVMFSPKARVINDLKGTESYLR